MTLYKQCDDVLSFMMESPNLFLPLRNIEKKYGMKINDARFPKDNHLLYVSIVAILITDGFIEQVVDVGELKGYRMTNKGLAFYHTDSYKNRSEKWTLERQVKERELTKLNWEVTKLKPTYNLARWGFWLAIIGLGVSTLIGILGLINR